MANEEVSTQKWQGRSINRNTEHITMKRTQQSKKNKHRGRKEKTKRDTRIEHIKIKTHKYCAKKSKHVQAAGRAICTRMWCAQGRVGDTHKKRNTQVAAQNKIISTDDSIKLLAHG